MASRTFLTGAALGAGLVYFLDPDKGAERRRRAIERLDGWVAPAGGAPGGGERYGSRLGDLAGLEAATLGPAPASRSPAMLLALLGGALALYGLARRGSTAAAARTVGLGLLAGGARQAGGTGTAERRRVVDIQKSLHIAAPVATVFAFWDSYESFPLFLPSVREVEDLGGGRARWAVRGPRGEEITWETVLTRRVPGELIAWRSEPGSMLVNAGAIRFTPEQGGTRVDLRFCYQPPAHGAGPAVTELLGADPRATLNEDLGRLKAVLEASTRSEAHGQESGS